MEVSPLISPNLSPIIPTPYTAALAVGEPQIPVSVDAQVIASLNSDTASSEDKFLPTYTGLAISSEQILQKLNEALGKYGKSVEQLAPEDATPEATSDRILKGIKGLFAAYKDQNPDLQGADLVDGFIEQATKGVDQGYKDAHEILDGIGAFSFNGVEDSIAKTLSLVKEGLGTMRDELLKTTTDQAAATTTQSLVSQGFYAVA